MSFTPYNLPYWPFQSPNPFSLFYTFLPSHRSQRLPCALHISMCWHLFPAFWFQYHLSALLPSSLKGLPSVSASPRLAPIILYSHHSIAVCLLCYIELTPWKPCVQNLNEVNLPTNRKAAKQWCLILVSVSDLATWIRVLHKLTLWMPHQASLKEFANTQTMESN